MGRLIVVLPAYNEEVTLPPLLERYAALGIPFHMVVVDDGSDDRTVERIAPYQDRMSLEIVSHGVNRGLGCAMQTGMARAIELVGADGVIVSMDADNSHLPRQIPEMLRKIERGSDVVIASRYRKGSVVKGVPRHRRMLSWGLFLLLKALFPVPGVRDYSCGFRAYRASAMDRAVRTYGDRFITASGFQVQLEILLKLARLGATFAEIPMELRYDFKLSPSKIRIGRTIANSLRVMWNVRRLPKAAARE